MDMSWKTKLKEVVMKITLALSSIWVYMPIVAGLITPMLSAIPIAYTSWFLFLALEGRLSWASSIYSLSLPFEIVLYIFDCIIFIFGLILFFWGFVHIVKARKNDSRLTQTGPYHYIRHPQHLGIILFSLPFALVIPWYKSGIRISDILSWALFCIVLIIWSDIEERKMRKKYPEEFADYKSKTGFFFPKVRKSREVPLIQNKILYYFVRYLIIFSIYCIIVLSMFLVTKYVPGAYITR